MSVKQINNSADRLEQVVEEMQELLAEAGNLIRTMDSLGKDVGSDLTTEFDHYICPNLQIRMGEGGCGYMTHDKGLLDLANRAREYADELANMEE